ncbi:DNA adenine methylase [Clostridium tyrobutyricum]|uniref:DNA adenine methylase n=1 Tax=Clostridium tyrobutyricum TaxID=1519 RepID=UPI001C38DC80|nr:DNA adenine methylase [Clostridium tyrobutyricum]MBV4438760.1 DNA adenine methylase [Clostridium tyrobutyricum]
MFYSPLRYPGGKSKLAPLMKVLIEKTNHVGGTYIEPFAGGAGIALDLLENDIVSQIVINDLDKGIYSFWRSVLNETDRFIDAINDVPLDINEWNRQRNIMLNSGRKYNFDLGFATFYMNRTNRSGIINGGVIGGAEQIGNWKMDARFNKENLIKRISKIVSRKNSIHIYNKDVSSLVQNYLPKYEKNAFVYFDPPYFAKGKQLYLNFFDYKDHVRIERMINESVNCDWVITYDDVPEIANIYMNHELRRFDLNYSAAVKRTASEIIIFSSDNMIPDSKCLDEKNICINLR